MIHVGPLAEPVLKGCANDRWRLDVWWIVDDQRDLLRSTERQNAVVGGGKGDRVATLLHFIGRPIELSGRGVEGRAHWQFTGGERDAIGWKIAAVRSGDDKAERFLFFDRLVADRCKSRRRR